MPKAALRLTNDELVGKNAHVYLDDREISRAVKAVTVHCAVGEVTTATLKVFVDKLDVETKAALDLNVANTELLARQLASLTAPERDEVLARVVGIQEERASGPALCETTTLIDTSRKYVPPPEADHA